MDPCEDGYRYVRRPTIGLSDGSENCRNICVGSSNPGDKIVDEGTEASKYGTIAVNMYNKNTGAEFELVKTIDFHGAPMPTGKIFHLNFEAKEIHNPHALPQFFFAELTQTDTDSLSANKCFRYGPTESLPNLIAAGRAQLDCCLYCGDAPVYHPRSRNYRSGRELQSVCDVINRAKKFKLQDHYYGPSCSGDMYERCATIALKVYNEEKDTDFELEEVYALGGAHLSVGMLMHLNFDSKKKDDPNARMQTFFTEVLIGSDDLYVDYCKLVGEADSLPDEPDLRQCTYCMAYGDVHHPPGFGYLTGWEVWPFKNGRTIDSASVPV